MSVMLTLPDYLFQQEITQPRSFLGDKYLSFPSKPQVPFAQRRLATAVGWWGQWTSVPRPSSRPCPLVGCLGHPSPSRAPRPPLVVGPWCPEGYAARTHHPPRPDLHLTAGLGAARRSPSFPPGEAEGLELGSLSGLLREEHQEWGKNLRRAFSRHDWENSFLKSLVTFWVI